MTDRRFVVVLTLLALTVPLSGCVAFDTPSSEPDDVDPEAVFKGVYVHSEDLEDVRGTMTSTITDGNRTVTETVRLYERPYVDYRDKVLEASDPDRVGQVYVSNGTTSWWYYPDRQQADYVRSSTQFGNDEVKSARADVAADQLEKYEIEHRGTEAVAGREAHVLDLEAKNETVANDISVLVGDTQFVYALETVDVDSAEHFHIVEQTVWIDAEYEYPLKEKVVWETRDGGRIVMTERFESVAFNTGLDDETFDFEPPEGTDVYEST